MNLFKTAFLMTFMTLLLLAIGYTVGQEQGMVLAFGFSLLLNFGSYWFSDKIVLASYRARVVSESEEPELHAMVRRLTQRAGLPMPRVAVVPTATPNAFATGRGPSTAVVAVTEGLRRLLPANELEAVIAHELGHVRNRDTLISTIAAALAGAITMIARFGFWFGGGSRDDDDRGASPIVAIAMLILAPIAATLVQLAVSRSREFAADAAAAELTKRPMDLARALARLEGASHIGAGAISQSTAHLMIVNPLKGGMSGLFRTHPSTEDRIARLEALAHG